MIGVAWITGGVLAADTVFAPGVAMHADSPPFQAASLGKTLTAILVLRSVARGEVALDDPILRDLRDWRPPPSAFDWHTITYRQVLSHTAGLSLPDYPGFAPPCALPTTIGSLDGATNGAGRLTLDRAPGMEFAYSGGGYTLLQLALEQRHGACFDDIAQREIFAPLALRHVSFDPSAPLVRTAPRGHDADGRPLPFFQFDAAAAAGLIATPSDIAQILIALVDDAHGRKRLLPRELVDEMCRPHADTGCVDGLWPRYGLGVEIDDLPGRGRMIGHHGMNRGWRAVMAIETASGDGIVAMANHDATMPALNRLVGARYPHG